MHQVSLVIRLTTVQNQFLPSSESENSHSTFLDLQFSVDLAGVATFLQAEEQHSCRLRVEDTTGMEQFGVDSQVSSCGVDCQVIYRWSLAEHY